MRKGVITVDINGTTRLASKMYADNNTLYRGHLQGFSQYRAMTDALAGRTSMSVSSLVVRNENEEYDNTLFSGSVDIKIGDETDAIAQMDDVIIDAQIVDVQRNDHEISINILDGQSRGNTKQQRIFDTSGDGFGTLLPEIWGKANKFPLIVLWNNEKAYGCAGPLVSVSAVYIDNVKQASSEYTLYLTGTTAQVVFTVKPEGSVFIDAVGFGSTLPGGMLYGLLTRISTVCQGMIAAWSGATMTLDERADDATVTLVGKTITKLTPSGGIGTRTITAYDSVTRIATLSSAWGIDPVIGTDIYSIAVNTAAGGFTTSQVDITGFDALDVSLPYTFGLIAADGISAIELQDQLLAPLLCHMGTRRDGMVQLKRLTPATGTAVMTIDRIIGDMTRKPMQTYWSVEARYRSDNTGGHWRSTTAFDAAIKHTYSDAKTKTIDAPVQEKAGADAVAQHWLTCFGEPTEIITMQVDHDLTKLELGDVVNVVDDRYQFAGGKLAVVVSMLDVFNGYDELGIWVTKQ